MMRYAVAVVLLGAPVHAASPWSVDLAGRWQFRLDPDQQGVAQAWYADWLPDAIDLPGSTDQAGYGTPNTRPASFEYLARVVEHVGPAWYQRTVTVPDAWRDHRVELSLERCHWVSDVWLDQRPVGERDSLCVPHVYDLGRLAPGQHRLTIRIDNRLRHDVGGAAHSTSEQTQTNWNGIIGRIELRARPLVSIDDLQVYPEAGLQQARVRIRVRNDTGGPISGDVRLPPGDLRWPVRMAGERAWIEGTLPRGDAPLWDEFTPHLAELTATLAAGRWHDERRVSFGWRNLAVSDKRLTLNDRRIFLRGTLECCIFPQTGYPPTDVAAWTRIFRIARDYGLNHLRFHSWCPPEAAFAAADEAGFLLQVELPCWVHNWGADPVRDRFAATEMRRILTAYGNHPSFAMLSMGNEPGGDYTPLHAFVREAQSRDPRHLYTAGSGWGAGATDDFHVTPQGRGIRGPGTERDLRDVVAQHPAPVVEHEVGQWTVYPRMAEIPKYDGVVRARNFERIRDDLAARGLLAEAETFTQDSGRLSALLYKEEIEVLLRTPGLGGFALLDLHDFPGQGTALVGMLDPFWDSKGLLEPADWRRFCSPTVPLVRMPKRVYHGDETFQAAAEVAHYGAADLPAMAARWWLADADERHVREGSFPATPCPTGDLTALGAIEFSLAGLPAPGTYRLHVALPNGVANDWSLWVYPARVQAEPETVVVARDWPTAAAALRGGRRVLLLVKRPVASVPGRFSTVFWSPVWFRNQPGTMGVQCDPRHPALAAFPTAPHADWQWWELTGQANAMVLDDLPHTIRPVVAAIDNFTRNHRLAYAFEASVDEGRLLACSLDLATDLDHRLAARQLRSSFLTYLAGRDLVQAPVVDAEVLAARLGQPISRLLELGAKVIGADSEEGDTPARFALDGDPETIWHTAWRDTKPTHPHELRVELPRPTAIAGLRYTPRQDMTNGRVGRWELYADGGSTPVATGQFADRPETQDARLPRPVTARSLRFVALDEVRGQPWTSVAELDVLLPDTKEP